MKIDLKAVLDRMEQVEGYFHREEGDLLCRSLMMSMDQVPSGMIVEVGSYLGRSTVALGLTVKMSGSLLKVHAIDPHEGELTHHHGLERVPPTLEKFMANIRASDLLDVVVPIVKKSYEVVWNGPIGLLFIDALHDYESVYRDFTHFDRWVPRNGRIAFHDHPEYPGVAKCVNEIQANPNYAREDHVHSLMVLRKTKDSIYAKVQK